MSNYQDTTIKIWLILKEIKVKQNEYEQRKIILRASHFIGDCKRSV